MKLGAWSLLTGVSVLACACGESVLGDGLGGTGGAGGAAAGSAGSAGSFAVAGSNSTAGVDPGQGGAGVGGAAPVGTAGAAGIGVSGVAPPRPLDAVGPQVQSTKLDLLFVIDNSVGMAPKQALLSASVPSFVQRLTNPRCVDAQGAPVAAQPLSGAAPCSSGTREFPAVTDLHLGVITTSLGSHGGTVCSTDGTDPESHVDDQAELLPTKRTGVPSYLDSGFLSFDSAGKTGVADASAVTTQLQTMITAAGDHGCGYEAPLEAMYRFLVDPAPPLSVQKNANGTSAPVEVNQALLAQRAAFLRPDSSVAITVLSDENDCSIIDTGVGWFVGTNTNMPASAAACATNPNDPCCRSCAQNEPSGPPAGCVPLAKDPVCSQVAPGALYRTLDRQHDSLNLRCFDQKARFGFDVLNPSRRYSVGLTNSQVVDWTGNYVDNPLFAARGGKPARSPSLISVSFIVGAPWQDLASADSLTSADLTYLDGASLESKQRWSLLVGDPANNVKPGDPLMIESIDPRSGVSPLTKAALVPATSTNPAANPDNGHERNLPNLDDLQYACIFPLQTPKVCAAGDGTCDCAATKAGDTTDLVAANSPLCQPPAGGPPSTTQYYDKGNPGTRELLVARDLGERAVPASICPKDASASGDANYGYVPALSALITRIAATLK